MKQQENQLELKNNCPPVGYNPIAAIRGAMFHWICVPFNSNVIGNNSIWCYVTCLNALQIQSCGKISCLYLPDDEEDIKKEKTLDELIEIKNAQEALIKLTLIKPTFEEIVNEITQSNFNVSEKKSELEKINKLITSEPDKRKRRKLERQAEKVEFYLGFLLPDDTMNFISSWALGIQITDIKRISRDILLSAAIMAYNKGCLATDMISGVLTDFQKTDINKHADYLLNQYLEDKKREQGLRKNNYKWG